MPTLAEWLKMLPGVQESGTSAFKAGMQSADATEKARTDRANNRLTNETSAANRQAIIDAAKAEKALERRQYLNDIANNPGATTHGGGFSITPRDNAEDKRRNKALQAANIQGFQVTDEDVIPSSKDAEVAKNQHTLAQGMDTDLTGISKDLSEANLLDRLSLATVPLTARARNINQGLQNAMMNAKEISKLGVPNRKDLEIVTGQIGDVGSLRSLFVPKEQLQDSLNRARERTSRELVNATTARGYTALPGTVPYKAPITPQQNPAPMSEDQFITNFLAKKKGMK